MKKIKIPDKEDLPKGTQTLVGRLISTKGKYFIATLEDYTNPEYAQGQRPIYNIEIPKKYIKRESPLKEYEQFLIYLIPRENKKPILCGYQIILPALSKQEMEEIRKKVEEELKDYRELKELPPLEDLDDFL